MMEIRLDLDRLVELDLIDFKPFDPALEECLEVRGLKPRWNKGP